MNNIYIFHQEIFLKLLSHVKSHVLPKIVILGTFASRSACIISSFSHVFFSTPCRAKSRYFTYINTFGFSFKALKKFHISRV